MSKKSNAVESGLFGTKLVRYSMNSAFCALALLGISTGAASAQESVTIYGVVDMALYKEIGNNALGSEGVRLDSGGLYGSRLGFKGAEDLGDGLSVSWLLETGIAVDTGGSTQGGLAFGRQSWLGLNGGFGSVKLGHQYTPIYLALDKIDPFDVSGAGDASRLMANGGFRMNNTINYSTPGMGGFSAQAAYGFGEVAGNSSGLRQIGSSASYENGPAVLVLAYHGANNITDTNTTKNLLLGGTYNLGVATAHLGYGINKDDAGLDTRDLLIGVTVPFGVSSILGSYIHKDDKKNVNANASQYAIGYTYAMSKRTTLYTTYSYTANDSAATYNVDAATPGAADKLYNIGIRHMF